MTMSEKVEPHTPLPWRREHEYIVSENGIAHASFDYTLDANYIVLACNSYPALLAERDRLREALKLVQFGGARHRCPICAGWNMSERGETDDVHTKDCPIGVALKDTNQ